MTDKKDSLGVWDGEFSGNHVARKNVSVAIDFLADAPGFAVAAEAAAANLQRAEAFLQAFLERAPDGHGFADAFHLRGERGVGLRKFLEGKARNLGDDVINARLEARGGVFADIVLEFVQQVADGEFGGDLRDGKAGGLGRERGAAADAGVHLDGEPMGSPISARGQQEKGWGSQSGRPLVRGVNRQKVGGSNVSGWCVLAAKSNQRAVSDQTFLGFDFEPFPPFRGDSFSHPSGSSAGVPNWRQ